MDIIDDGKPFNTGNYVKGRLGPWISVDLVTMDAAGFLHRAGVKTAKVDGVKIKADTWYWLVKGEFVEIPESPLRRAKNDSRV